MDKKTEKKEFDVSEKVEVFNIAPWNVAFSARVGRADIRFAPNGTQRVTREELFEQIQNGNKLFTGVDGEGNHCTLYIMDTDTREYVGFEKGRRKQFMMTDEYVTKLFDMPYDRFVSEVESNIKIRAEKRYLLTLITKLKLNQHDKIEFCKEYCKFRLY